MVRLEVKDSTLYVHGNLFIPGAVNINNWISDKGVKVYFEPSPNDFLKDTIEINADFLLLFKEVSVYGTIYVD